MNMGKYHGEDLVGRRFGKLTVMKRAGTDAYRRALWECDCSCGNSVIVSTSDLKSGNVKSCGCLRMNYRPRLWRGDYTVTYNGKTQTVSEWAEEFGLNYFTLYRRLQRGWDVERALSTVKTK
jgi:hypothetical protein